MRFVTRAIAGLLLAVALTPACGPEDDKEAGAWPDSLPDETIGDFRTEETDSGRVQWKLISPQANRLVSQNVFLLDAPQIEFFDKEGHLQTTLVSEHGEYTQRDGSMLAYGNVVVTSVEGNVLETDSLRYLNDVDMIVSDSPVRLTRGEDVLTGIGFVADRNLSSVNIKRDLKATITKDDSGDEE